MLQARPNLHPLPPLQQLPPNVDPKILKTALV